MGPKRKQRNSSVEEINVVSRKTRKKKEVQKKINIKKPVEKSSLKNVKCIKRKPTETEHIILENTEEQNANRNLAKIRKVSKVKSKISTTETDISMNKKKPEKNPELHIITEASAKSSLYEDMLNTADGTKIVTEELPFVKTEKYEQDSELEAGYIQHCENRITFKTENSTSSSESEWEEVETVESQQNIEDYEPEIPKEGVEIILEGSNFHKKHRKRKEFDMVAFVRCQINRFKKDVQMAMHKVHLLCLVAHGIYINDILNEPDIKGLALSLVPIELIYLTEKKTKVDTDIIRKIIEWFRNTFVCEASVNSSNSNIKQQLALNFEVQKASSDSEYAMMFVIISRILGLDVRLCLSFYPLSFKPSNLLRKNENMCSTNRPKKKKNLHRAEETILIPQNSLDKETTKSKQGSNSKSVRQKKKQAKINVVAKIIKDKTVTEMNNLRKVNTEIAETSAKGHNKNIEEIILDEEDQYSGRCVQNVQRSRPKRSLEIKTYKLSSDDNADEDSDEDFIIKKDNKSDEKDFVDTKESIYSRKNKKKLVHESVTKVKQNIKKESKKNRKILSSDSDNSVIELEPELQKVKGIEYWTEIYSKSEGKWISLDCSSNTLNKPYEIEALATQPVTYVIAFDNKSYVKDVTKRYSCQWFTHTRKLRVDSDWWEESLEPFKPPRTKQDKEEEKQLETMLINKPMPSTISQFKNHPLYALKRHLLKFEGIYPPDAPPVGFIRGEPVYARECICTLHSRETWMKEARVVRIGEQPYKVVKARPKWDKIAGEFKTDLPLGLFGHWQTEEYIPPIAQNGKVPRNEYGNVELFQPSMLPKGTVHLQMSGLNRIARKLEIDCSPALVGFDGHCGAVHPVFDGWIVCEEFKETLIAAWEEEQVNIRKREQEKREKRVYGNWKKLIKGLLIKERIKTKYPLQ